MLISAAQLDIGDYTSTQLYPTVNYGMKELYRILFYDIFFSLITYGKWPWNKRDNTLQGQPPSPASSVTISGTYNLLGVIPYLFVF